VFFFATQIAELPRDSKAVGQCRKTGGFASFAPNDACFARLEIIVGGCRTTNCERTGPTTGKYTPARPGFQPSFSSRRLSTENIVSA
jgi:hypothetical protein